MPYRARNRSVVQKVATLRPIHRQSPEEDFCVSCRRRRLITSDLSVEVLVIPLGKQDPIPFRTTRASLKDAVVGAMLLNGGLCAPCARAFLKSGQPFVQLHSRGIVKRLTHKQWTEQENRLARRNAKTLEDVS